MATKLYETLEVPATATTEEIRKAYKKRALKTHPDRLGPTVTPEEKKSAEEQFRQVNQAYEILTDAEKRKEYDIHGQWPPPTSAPRPSQSRHRAHVYEEHDDPFSHPFFHNHNPDPFRSFAFTDPFTLFESIFGNAGPRPSGNPTFTTTSFFPNEPFIHVQRQHDSEMNGFMSFPPMGGIFGSLSGGISTGGFGGQTFGVGSSGGQWASESFSTQTINGVTQTVHTKRDFEGNEHVTRIHGDGREVYTINGIEQTRGHIKDQPAHSSTSHQVSSTHSRRHSSRDVRSTQPQQRPNSYQSRHGIHYTIGATPQTHPNQYMHSHSQPQYSAHNHTQSSSIHPLGPSDGKRRRDSQRSEKKRHSYSSDTSQTQHQQHSGQPNKSKGFLSSLWDRLNSGLSSAIHHGNSSSSK
ncbi:hypothetical protein BKA70DRAFT_476568 [Coprinopsis sp. MPI-PUGE-AT-0042]|nr:hypothetical protein BKA70DRAFT_476568 [Coprinopsis sp. MPI-PUGE-AT-0042]